MSIGIKSGVNWMRLNLSDIVSASLLTIKRLGQPGHAHQERMAAGEEADRQPLDDVVLADDDLGQLLAQPGIRIPQVIDRLDVVFAQPLGAGDSGPCAMKTLLLSLKESQDMQTKNRSHTPRRGKPLTSFRHSSREATGRERVLN